MASSRIVGIASDQFHVFIGRTAQLDLRCPQGAIKVVGPALFAGPFLAKHQLARCVHVEEKLATRLQAQGIANVLGDSDLAFAGDCGLHGSSLPVFLYF